MISGERIQPESSTRVGAYFSSTSIWCVGSFPFSFFGSDQARLREKKIDTAKVKVFWTTPGYVDYVWTARKAVPEDVRKKFADAFLKLDKSKPEDAKILALQDAKKFVAGSPKDFDAVEKVALSTGLLKPKK